jgi:hypothetical protein
MRGDVQPGYRNNNQNTETTTRIQKQQPGYRNNNQNTIVVVFVS